MEGPEPINMQPLVSLVKRVSRAFFENPYIVIMDELTKHELINDEELSKSIGLTIKEIHKLCGTLKEAKMLNTHTKMEPKKADQRPVPKMYYYIDWHQFVMVTKWKIYQIRQKVQEKMQSEQNNKGYLCSNCGKTFAALDIKFLIQDNMTLACDVCRSEIQHNDNADNLKGSEKLHGRFMEQSKPIIDLLKDIDTMKIPSSNPMKLGPTPLTKGASQSPQDKELAYAQDSGLLTDIVVVFQENSEASKKSKEAEIEKKRQQNELPAWHRRSTVSNDTIIEETPRKEKVENNEIEVESLAEKSSERESYYTSYYEQYQQGTASSTPSTYHHSNQTEEIEDDEFEEVDIQANL
ncbi:9055_t:CDS:10 [Ambispora gerdemannii]|uniref:9055_t:CDS:1 n=1 Tax=Ambispora gerdemannii TaxID=144530 RepID=A0A9N8WUK1_9GLOM|nr:9055_t:CDS:10 [Ambispora gerdemannii]